MPRHWSPRQPAWILGTLGRALVFVGLQGAALLWSAAAATRPGSSSTDAIVTGFVITAVSCVVAGLWAVWEGRSDLPVGSVLLRWIIVAVIASLVAPVYNQTVEQEPFHYALLAYGLGLLVFGGPVVASAMVGWLIGRGLKPAPAAQLASDPR